MRYVNARIEQEYRAEAYRFYVTDSLQLSAQNKYLTNRYYDIIHPKPVDARSGDDIAMSVILGAGLKSKKKGE